MLKLYTVGEMTQIFNARQAYIAADSLVRGFSIDSRTLQSGDWFFCIEGENTDGHRYISQALQNGAGGVVANAEKIPEALHQQKFPRILVPEPNLALREWAADVRNQFSGKVLGITGSNGKTSTKEILAGLCRAICNGNSGDSQVHATYGNFNNFIGVPLTLLAAPVEAKWWVVEMGTNHFGEIAELSKIVRPTGGIITDIGESHLEFLQNTEGVAREKAGLFAGMSAGSHVVFPDSLQHRKFIEAEAEKKKLRITNYELRIPANRQPSTVNRFRLFGAEFETRAGRSGLINNPLLLQNLVGALTLLHLEGVSLVKLQEVTASLELSVKGRFQQILLDGWILIDDTYNANPSSFRGVLESLQKMYPERRRLVVCGAMAELGGQSPEFHRQVAKIMLESGVEKMFALGGSEPDDEIQSKARFYLEGWENAGGVPQAAKYFTDLDELTGAFRKELRSGDAVLVKGSRSARMERFVEKMRKHID